jgi:hypothetical protein
MLYCNMVKFYLFTVSLFFANLIIAQDFKIYGKITNTKLEPLAYVNVEVKNNIQRTTTKEDGSYKLFLEDGKYELVVSLVGYKKQLLTVTINKSDALQNILLEEDKNSNKDVVTVMGIRKDHAEEYIRNVIRRKEDNTSNYTNYTTSLYIKATEENSNKKIPKIKYNAKDTARKIDTANRDIIGMSMAEIQMQLDMQLPNKIKETRNGVKKRGNPESLFYLSTTEGDFSLYNNLMRIPAVSVTPFLSPISYSGLVAYRYKTIRTRKEGARTLYTISFKPTKMGNALLSGEVEIMDSTWVIIRANYSLPKYHLVEYDNFLVEQEYRLVNDTAWMYSKQKFIYNAKEGKNTKNGTTSVFYKDYSFNQTFPKKHFGMELSTTAQSAYEKDSSFWQTVRTEPLTDKEVRFIRYKDSVYQATHTKVYLDSIDAITNKITPKKILFDGITFYNRKRERTIYIGSVSNLYEPFSPGGGRVGYNFFYRKIFQSKKDISIPSDFSYGIRNKDLNGNIDFNRMYNPFSRGAYRLHIGRSFGQLFEGDVLINSFQKRNIFRKYHLKIGHNLELLNGLFLDNELEIAYRQSLANFKFYDWAGFIKDSASIAQLNRTNTPIDFPSHGALYNNVTLSYTPFQHFMREPKEKIILGSKWPTFSLQWRKGIPNVLGSKVDYDNLEFRIYQRLPLGTVGISEYTFITGTFLNKKYVENADKKYIRGRDPYLFLFPQGTFQHIDSTFTLDRSFYEFHYVHEFNGAILNKIPLLKQLKLRELAGGGFLFAPERNLRYFEAFFGIESMPFRILRERFKLGVFVVGSVANQSRNPIQLKFSIRQWDKRNNRWM